MSRFTARTIDPRQFEISGRQGRAPAIHKAAQALLEVHDVPGYRSKEALAVPTGPLAVFATAVAQKQVIGRQKAR